MAAKSPNQTAKMKKESSTLLFIKMYDGGSFNCRKSKQNGRKRVKRAVAKQGRRVGRKEATQDA